MEGLRPDLRLMVPPAPHPTSKKRPPILPAKIVERIVLEALDSNFDAIIPPEWRNSDIYNIAATCYSICVVVEYRVRQHVVEAKLQHKKVCSIFAAHENLDHRSPVEYPWCPKCHGFFRERGRALLKLRDMRYMLKKVEGMVLFERVAEVTENMPSGDYPSEANGMRGEEESPLTAQDIHEIRMERLKTLRILEGKTFMPDRFEDHRLSIMQSLSASGTPLGPGVVPFI